MYASRNPVTSEIRAVKSDINDILQSGKYYCTEEIARELTKINNGLDHIKLDENLLSTSQTWKHNFDPNQTFSHRNSVISNMDKTSATLYDIKNQLNIDKLKDDQENELREKHQWAINNLKSVQQDLNPYANIAANRIQQFSDQIGVTDRFTQYRNNKMKIPEPTRTQTQQMMRMERARTSIGTPAAEMRTRRYGERLYDNYGVMGNKIQYGEARPTERVYKGYRTIDSLYPRATSTIRPGVIADPNYSQTMSDIKTLNTMNAVDLAKSQSLPKAVIHTDPHLEANTAAELAGINTVYPGTTLYNDEYVPPNFNLPTSPFIINPRPDFLVNGRPLAKAQVMPPISSEYQTRYEWPEAKKMTRLPWLNAH